MWSTLLIYSTLFFGARYALMHVMRYLANQATQSRQINEKKILKKQKDREAMWPQGLFMDLLLFIAVVSFGWINFELGPFWSCLGLMWLVHLFVVEPIYYFYHRLLHTSWFYKHHHLVHHRSVIIAPTTSMTFTLSERFSYSVLFAVPSVFVILLEVCDIHAVISYYIIFDFFNAFGHLNVRLESKKYKTSKVWKWLIYSPEFHEKHHSLFTTNYSLFVPFYDRLFGTATLDPIRSSELAEDQPSHL